jgi:hypothetical protein
MNKLQEEEIIKLAFYEELEKQANPIGAIVKTLLPKLLSGGSKYFNPSTFKAYTSGAKAAFGKGGAEGMKYLKSFANPEVIRKGGEITTQKVSKKVAKEVAKNTGTIQKIVGGAAREFEFLGKGMLTSPNKFKTLGKNIIDDTKRSWTAARHKILPNEKYVVNKQKMRATRKLPKFFENNTIAKKINDKLSRKVSGFTADGKAITQKRKLMQAGALAFTPAGMLATGVATGDSEEGVKDYALWKVPAVAGSKMLYDIVKPGE